VSPIRKPSQPGSRPSGPGQRVSHGLVALSSAVVMAVYSAGYLRTQAAADLFDAEAGQRRPAVPPPTTAISGESEADAPAPGATPVAMIAAEPAAPPAVPRVEAEAAPVVTAPATTGSPTAKATPPAVPATSTTAVESVADPVTLSSPTAPASATQPAPVTAAVSAPAPASPATPPVPAAPRYKDGTFTGWGTSRHGDIEAQIIIANGRITSATISQCWTRWPCSWVAALPGQVVARQSPETDFVSGATQSTNAFYYAVVQALGKASLP
jgi:uncharacterized protein with FMN-binding domain